MFVQDVQLITVVLATPKGNVPLVYQTTPCLQMANAFIAEFPTVWPVAQSEFAKVAAT
jgi:hypothetical protein